MNQQKFVFDKARIGILERDSKLLVMDRVTGRSVYMPSSNEQLLKLIASREESLPSQLIPLRIKVIKELASHGIGVELQPHFETLNTVILKLTNACNYACKYCYDHEPQETATNLQINLALATLEEALELCDKRLQVIFHGGEPFLMFDRIKKIVLASQEIAARLDKRILFTGQTNLSLLTDDAVSFSMEHNIYWGFSLDGSSSHNDIFRISKSSAGTHENFEKALEKFPEFVRNCSAMATITSANHNDLLNISRYFQSCGLSGWDWSLFQPIGRGRSNQDIDFDVIQLIDSWNELFDAIVDGEFDGFAISPVLKYVENFLNGPGRNMCMRKECGAGRDLLSISANGQIEACDCIDPLSSLSNLGDIKDTSLAVARESEKACLIRSRDVQKDKCDRCIWLAVCGGTCLARSPSLHGIHEKECQVALNAFDRISSHLAESNKLKEYAESCY
jgi:uncharacterized protein